MLLIFSSSVLHAQNCENIIGTLQETNGDPVSGMTVQLFIDENDNGVLDENDKLTQEVGSDTNGDYSFSIPDQYSYADDFERSTLVGDNYNSGELLWTSDWRQSNASNSGIYTGSSPDNNFSTSHIFIKRSTTIERDFQLTNSTAATLNFDFDVSSTVANARGFRIFIDNDEIYEYNHTAANGSGAIRNFSLPIPIEYIGDNNLELKFTSTTTNSSAANDQQIWIDNLKISTDYNPNLIVKPLSTTYKKIKPSSTQSISPSITDCTIPTFEFQEEFDFDSCNEITGDLKTFNGDAIDGMEVNFFVDMNNNGALDNGDSLMETAVSNINGEYNFTPKALSIEDDFSGSVFTARDNSSGTIPWNDFSWARVSSSNVVVASADSFENEGNDFTTQHVALRSTTSIRRSFSLENASDAAVNFQFDTHDDLKVDDEFYLEISTDGSNYSTLYTYTHETDGLDVRDVTINISEYVGNNDLTIRFRTSSSMTTAEYIFLDNVVINAVSGYQLIVKPVNSTYESIKPSSYQVISPSIAGCALTTFEFQETFELNGCDQVSGKLTTFDGAPVNGMEVQYIVDINGNGIVDSSDAFIDSNFSDSDGNYSYSPMLKLSMEDDFSGGIYTGTNNDTGFLQWKNNAWVRSSTDIFKVSAGYLDDKGNDFTTDHLSMRDDHTFRRRFSLVGATDAALHFQYDTHDELETDDSFYVEISEDGSNFTTIFTYDHTTPGLGVRDAVVNISEFAGKDNLTLQFRTGENLNDLDNIWLDNIGINLDADYNIIINPINDNYNIVTPNQSQVGNEDNGTCTEIDFVFSVCQNSSPPKEFLLKDATPNGSITESGITITNSVHFAGTATTLRPNFGNDDGNGHFRMEINSSEGDGNNDATGGSIPAILNLRNYLQSSYVFSTPATFEGIYEILDLDSSTELGEDFIDAVALIVELADGTIVQPDFSLNTGSLMKTEIIPISNSASGAEIDLVENFPNGIQVAYMNDAETAIDPVPDPRSTVVFEMDGLSVKRFDIVYFNAAVFAEPGGFQTIYVPSLTTVNECLDPIQTFAENDINQTPMNRSVGGQLLTNDVDPEKNPQSVTNITTTDMNGNEVITTIPKNGDSSNITIYDEEPDNSGSYIPVGTIIVNSDGSYTFNPATDYSGNVPSIGYSIIDVTGAKDNATLDIDVIPSNDPLENNPPVANDDTNTTDQDVPVGGNVIDDNDYDPDTPQDNLVITEIEVPDGSGGTTTVTMNPITGSGIQNIPNVGTIEMQPEGSYSFVPDPNFTGDVPPIKYTIQDPNGGKDSAILEITVNPDPDKNINNTYANDNSNTGAKNTEQTGNVKTNDKDPEGNPTEITEGTTSTGETITMGVEVDLPSGGKLTLNSNGDYEYNPAIDFIGTEVVKYRVCDDQTPEACEFATLYLTTLDQTVFLPVELISFSVTKHGEDASLNWTTASELNNEKFELEYSLDGTSFKKFAEVAGQGTTREATDYSYTQIGIGQNAEQVFYRLKQVDYDGTASYSDIEVVVFASINDLVVYPVPAKQGEQIIVTGVKALGGFKVYDVKGVLVWFGANKKSKSVSIPTSQLNAGTYFVVFNTGKNVRIVVE